MSLRGMPLLDISDRRSSGPLSMRSVSGEMSHNTSFGGASMSEVLEDVVRKAMADKELVRNRRYHLKSYPNCFVGREFVDFILKAGYDEISNREEAIVVAELAFESGLFEHVTRDHSFVDDNFFYRFTAHASRASHSLTHLPPAVERLYRQSKAAVPVADREFKGCLYRQTFVASELVDYLVSLGIVLPITTPPQEPRADAVAFGELLRQHGFIRHCVQFSKKFQDDYLFFRFIRLVPGEALARWYKVKAIESAWGVAVDNSVKWKPNAPGARLAPSIYDSGMVIETGYDALTHDSGELEFLELAIPQPLYENTFIDKSVLMFYDSSPTNPAIFVLEALPDASVATMAVPFHRGLLFTKQSTRNVKVSLESSTLRSSLSKTELSRSPTVSNVLIQFVRTEYFPTLNELRGNDMKPVPKGLVEAVGKGLVAMERKRLAQQSRFKFGVLRFKSGQTNEDDAYMNNDMSAPLEVFMDMLAEKVTMAGFTGYSGGLSAAACSHSYYTVFSNVRVMFHVAPMIQLDAASDTQGVGRKRYVGNDVCVIIFRDSFDPESPFDADALTSHFNHVFCVVTPEYVMDELHFHLAFVYKYGVPPHLPQLHHPAVFRASEPDLLKDFLLTKLINAELAAYNSPEFLSSVNKTKCQQLLEVVSVIQS